ncbi:hypothetical protein [Leptospira sp. GIMC2001]|uniref:hypothetical protein n=1 Tax=Leptospira sp. GIMC2001 TaxID=1513297 RepID=UPI00234B8CDD|nr:hypothetical protein [Leptospira sp. GIMC2001]WCL48479.1 hypothetical protein O4O04_14365 [Leptospira sp. GIMC2001]
MKILKINWFMFMIPVYLISIQAVISMTMHPNKNPEETPIDKPDRRSNEFVVGANSEILDKEFQDTFIALQISSIKKSSQRPITYIITFENSYDFDKIEKLAKKNKKILYIEPNFLYYKQKPKLNKLP